MSAFGSEDEQRAADLHASQLQHHAGFEFLSHRRWRALGGARAETSLGASLPLSLVRRVAAAYQVANSKDHNGASMWTDYFNSKHQDSHAALMAGNIEVVAHTWANPANNYSFWGFDELHPDYTGQRRGSEIGQEIAAQRVYDNLLQFAMATGAVRLEYPEAPTIAPFDHLEDILNRLDVVMGFRIDFPNPYPFEYGLQTSRGVASYRAIQALFQAYQTKKLVYGVENARVLEIGPGLGRAAYYSYKAGIKSYTLIDLPFSNVSQAFFLGTTIGEDSVQLKGEQSGGSLKISTPDDFLNYDSRFDLVVNFDSLTEMDNATQRTYIEKIRSCADTFLSVNHEFNPFTVRSLIQEFFPNSSNTRDPYWMRRGYVQEIVQCNARERK